MKIILDMDPGIDDAVALLIALHNPELEVLAVTTANGNVDVHSSTRNALRIIEAVGKKVPVAKGASKPLFKPFIHSREIHGRDGLGNSNLPASRMKESRFRAINLIETLVQTHRKKEITIVATAPLTNIAILLEMEGTMANTLDKIVLMGGVYGVVKNARGNTTPYAEFNFYCDPEAANIVLNSGASVIAAGLDVTMNSKCAVRENMLGKIGTLGGRAAEIAAKMLTYQVRRYGLSYIHDAFAIAAMLNPSMFKFVGCRVSVDDSGTFRGRCVTTVKKDHVKVCSHVDHNRFVNFVLEGLKQH